MKTREIMKLQFQPMKLKMSKEISKLVYILDCNNIVLLIIKNYEYEGILSAQVLILFFCRGRKGVII